MKKHIIFLFFWYFCAHFWALFAWFRLPSPASKFRVFFTFTSHTVPVFGSRWRKSCSSTSSALQRANAAPSPSLQVIAGFINAFFCVRNKINANFCLFAPILCPCLRIYVLEHVFLHFIKNLKCRHSKAEKGGAKKKKSGVLFFSSKNARLEPLKHEHSAPKSAFEN